MSKQSKIIKSDEAINYMIRTDNRVATISDGLMQLVGYFMGLGDDYATAVDKSDQISYEILKTHTYALEGYERGNSRCKADLIDALNNVDENLYPFFDAAAKSFVIQIINQ